MLTQQQSLSLTGYKPLDPQDRDWGSGSKIVPFLGERSLQLWKDLQPLQDKRNDVGHAEMVTYFAHTLSGLVGMTGDKREVAMNAAIAHDAGYSLIPDVNRKFRNSLEMQERGGDSAKLGKELERNLRVQHQDYAVELVRNHLGKGGYSGTDEVCDIVGDHDTRLRSTSEAGKIMRDADYMFRLTNLCVEYYHQSESAEALSSRFTGYVKRERFETDVGFRVGRLEVANTLLYRFPKTVLPETFLSEFKEEIAIIERSQSAQESTLDFSTPTSSGTKLAAALRHLENPSLDPSEAAFIEKWSADVSPDRYQVFLTAWMRALKGQGTPLTYLDQLRFEQKSVTINGQTREFTEVTSPSGQQKAEIMAKTPPYQPKLPLASYEAELKIDSCPLCRHVVQALDAKKDPSVADLTVLDIGNFLLIPNRFPNAPGASLFMAKDHDDISGRTTSKKTANGMEYPREEGKTRCNLLDADYVLAMMRVCDEFGLVGLRNHAVDGMSVDSHDHFQMVPAEGPWSKNIVDMIKKNLDPKTGQPIQEGVISLSGDIFDSSVITNIERGALASAAVDACRKLELDNQVFALGYYEGHFVISTRKTEVMEDRKLGLGASIPFYHMPAGNSEFIGVLQKFVPLKGEFPWDKYLG